MTTAEQKEAWEKGKKALAKIMKYVPVDTIEKLADRVEDKEFRNSLQFKMFLNSFK